MAKNTKSKEVTPHNLWGCEDCKMGPLEHKEMLAHLETAHGVDTKGLKGKRSMIMHMDGDTWFKWQWAWEIESPTGIVKLTNETLSRRAKDDMMRYA